MRLVLWRAIEELKTRGVTEFKLGLGGEAVGTLGLFR